MDTKEKRPAPARRRSTASGRAPAKKETARPLQDVVYLPPKPFNRHRMLLRFATVAAIVLAIVLAMSVFFKVENIEVSGANNYTAWEITQASGISQGDHLMSFGIPGAAAKIWAKLPYISKVRIGIRLPNTVLIQVTEVPVAYAMKDQSETWWKVSSDGRVLEQAGADDLDGLCKVLGVQLLNPAAGDNLVAYENQTPGVDGEGNVIPITVTAGQRLESALNVMKMLEQCGIIGEMTSIDVNDLSDIQMWYGQRFQVKLGDNGDLEYKISSMKSAIGQLDPYETGVLDVRFADDPDQVIYTPFQ